MKRGLGRSWNRSFLCLSMSIPENKQGKRCPSIIFYPSWYPFKPFRRSCSRGIRIRRPWRWSLRWWGARLEERRRLRRKRREGSTSSITVSMVLWDITARPTSGTRSNTPSTSATTSILFSPSTSTKKWHPRRSDCWNYSKNPWNMTPRNSYSWPLRQQRKSKGKMQLKNWRRSSVCSSRTGNTSSLRWLSRIVYTSTSCNRKRSRVLKLPSKGMQRMIRSGSKLLLSSSFKPTVSTILRSRIDKIRRGKTVQTATAFLPLKTQEKTRRDTSISSCTRPSSSNPPSKTPHHPTTRRSRCRLKKSEAMIVDRSSDN